MVYEEPIRFYCGVNETKWNHHPVAPGKYACVAPVYGATERTLKENRVFIPEGVLVIQDSGAFSDSWNKRLSFNEALDRQKYHADKYNYQDKISHRASYDFLIDEVWTEGNRFKRRWSEDKADLAVSSTIKGAEFLANNREGHSLVFTAQGVTASQYLQCIQEIVKFYLPQDIIGLGGWCIIGKQPKIMMGVFKETLKEIIPFLAEAEVGKVHIWGVMYAKALGNLLWMCDKYGISLSTDSAGPSYRPAFGEWGYANWRDKNYVRPEPKIRGLERARHVEATRNWLESFRETVYYASP